MSKRDKTKLPALNKGVNTLARKDFIETDYIDGVKGIDGGYGIRPLNDQEKQWLNDFYEETIVTNFLRHPELKRLNKEKKKLIECRYVQKMKKQIKDLSSKMPLQKDLIKELKQTVKLTKEQNKEINYLKIRKIEKEMQKIRDIILLYPNKEDHKQFYNENNSRNNCIYTTCKKRGTLIDLDVDAVDSLMANHLECIDHEDILIKELEDYETLPDKNKND